MENFDVQESLFEEFSCILEILDDEIYLFTKNEFPEKSDFRNILGLTSENNGSFWTHKARFASLNAFVLRYALRSAIGRNVRLSSEDSERLKKAANNVTLPSARLSDDGKFVEILSPNLKVYKELFSRLGAYPNQNGWRLRLDRLMDFELSMDSWKSHLPKIEISKDLLKLNREPIPGFDGTVDSLRAIPIGALNIVRANVQNRNALKNSKATLEEKLAKLKLSTLHDLLFRLPRRYIDKSKPQLISDLIEGETATIIGKISALSTFTASVGGLRVSVVDSTGSEITSTFWRQAWLQTKFSVGDEVILTGAVGSWKGKPQLNGHSIEHFDEGIVLPVVPIYKQSESSGITSGFLISAIRELLQRLGDVKLPVYFKAEGRQPYIEILHELHLPSNLETHKSAILAMSYYELVYLQLIIQDSKKNVETRPGVPLPGGDRKLQTKAMESFPFDLTNSQKKATAKLNELLATSTPNSSLLIADVGAGKTLVAQLACLRAVDSGAQAIIVGPTDVLARQIYATTKQLVETMKEKFNVNVRVELLVGGIKATERKSLLKDIADGSVDIIVGTQAVFSETVKYNNLGFVVIDEQQKFGAEQRTKLLNSREDGRIPDLLLQTATPIPRSTAQVYYGDIDPILMKDKPLGRLPIETVWISEDPKEVLQTPLHPIWLDVIEESSKGNQSFVITPMVVDSAKIDAASVERSYKELSGHVLKGLRVGFVHGQMKIEDQRATMEKFQNKELDVLVASTVIEVGVDIPDATRMIILSAERMGASSLHQIRGRVGRNSKKSKCYLVSIGSTDSAQSRLQSLVNFDNGFDIAKEDLRTRGEGTIFSSDQSGRSEMIFANLAKHSNLIAEAKEEALRILKSPFKEIALKDAQEKFESPERLF